MKPAYIKMSIFFAFACLHGTAAGQSVQYRIQGDSNPPTGAPDIRVVLKGQLDLTERIEADQKQRDVREIQSPNEFLTHLIWTWRAGSLEDFLENWTPEERTDQAKVFSAANLDKQRAMATATKVWTKRASFVVAGATIFGVQREDAEGRKEMTFVTIVSCGSRLCMTNRLARDPLLSVVLMNLRKDLIK